MLGWTDPRPLAVAVGPDRAAQLAKKPGLHTLGDAVTTYPTSYVRTGSADALDELAEGEIYTCVAEILHADERENRSGRGARQYLRVVFTDGSLEMETALFGSVHLHRRVLVPGARVMLYGKVGTYRGKWQLRSPSYVTVDPGPDGSFGAFGPLGTIVDIAGSQEAAQDLLAMPFLPAYPRRPGTSTAELIGVLDHVLSVFEPPQEVLPDPHVCPGAPAWPRGPHGEELIGFADALAQIHQPPESGPQAARDRIKFNEALQLQLVMALRRADATKREARPIPMPGLPAGEDSSPSRGEGGSVEKIIAGLPYTLSEGQRSAINAIHRALAGREPASLMLQGDVGSGKTVVAVLAMAAAVDAGFQCAFIAPTEVLAAQHARSLTAMLSGTTIGVTLLTGSQKTAARKAALLDIVSGQADIVVGTHAIIQDSVEFYDLGLVIVDEQHRFGVHQRDRLREGAPVDATPHMVVMTATPIPRTVAMTMFGDLTPVTLKGLPRGRGSIRTAVVSAGNERWVSRMWERVREEVAAGHQAYVVVPRIDGDEGVDAWAQRLEAGALAGCTLDVLHGRMAAEDKDGAMAAFSSGETDVLVATTVIEVGVDVPNATMMVVLDADRFGVSQLHQLRGRIGRGAFDSWCLLHTSADPDGPSFARLTAVSETLDGFALAELDLKQRSEGDILGADQAGSRARRSKLLDLSEDGEIVREARRYAIELVAYDEAHARELVADIEVEDQDYIEKA